MGSHTWGTYWDMDLGQNPIYCRTHISIPSDCWLGSTSARNVLEFPFLCHTFKVVNTCSQVLGRQLGRQVGILEVTTKYFSRVPDLPLNQGAL